MEIIKKINDFIDLKKAFHVRSICSSYLPEWRPGTDYTACYSAHRDQGGGVRIDLIHEWDYLTALFGFPEHTFSLSGKYSSLRIDSEDIASYIAEYKNKIIELHLDYFGRFPRRQTEIYTDDYVYTLDLINNEIKANEAVIFHSNEGLNDKYVSEMIYFLDYCSNHIENINSIDNAISVMKLANK